MTKSLCTCTCNSNDWFKSENKANWSKQATEIGSVALSVTVLKNDIVTFLTETIICVILFFKFCVEEYGLQSKGQGQISGLVLIHVYFFTVSCLNYKYFTVIVNLCMIVELDDRVLQCQNARSKVKHSSW